MDLALANRQRDVLERAYASEGDTKPAYLQLELTVLELAGVQVVSINAGHPASLLLTALYTARRNGRRRVRVGGLAGFE
jgi:hypothetical protein